MYSGVYFSQQTHSHSGFFKSVKQFHVIRFPLGLWVLQTKAFTQSQYKQWENLQK